MGIPPENRKLYKRRSRLSYDGIEDFEYAVREKAERERLIFYLLVPDTNVLFDLMVMSVIGSFIYGSWLPGMETS